MSKKKSVSKAPREMSHRQLSFHKRQLRRQRIFLFGGLAVIVAVIGIILGGWLGGEYLPLHKIVLEVFGTKFDTGFYIDTMVLIARFQGSGSMSEISGTAVNQITGDELMIQEAGKLGVVITDEEARKYWDDSGLGIEVNDAAIHLIKSQLLSAKLKMEHFSSLVPVTDTQVHALAMMVESEKIAGPLRERILNGENFTLLTEQYAADTASRDVLGDYGWHLISIFKDKFLSAVPLDYISRADARVGDVSLPLSDNVSFKKLGYWLIKVNERPDNETANVTALYVGTGEEALTVRARLEAGADPEAIAEEMSQGGTSQFNQGGTGLIFAADNITNVFNGYVFGPDAEMGKWSQPLQDKEFTTKGGAWLVKIADMEVNRPLTTEDRDSLINKLYYEWTDKIWTEYSPSFINNLTNDDFLAQWAIDRATKKLN